jgi:hypothetical protein
LNQSSPADKFTFSGTVLSYRLCLILGYNKITPGVQNGSDDLASELKRRCFWACWGAICIFPEPLTEAEFLWQQAADTPLPAILRWTSNGCEVVLSQKMDDSWNAIAIDGDEESKPEFNAMNEVYKLLGIW